MGMGYHQILMTTQPDRNKRDRYSCGTETHRPLGGGEGTCQNNLGMPSGSTQHSYQPIEKANHAPESPCLRPRTVWWSHPHRFFILPFFNLACGEWGVGVTMTQFYHGGSHHRSDHFSHQQNVWQKEQTGRWRPYSNILIV